MTKSWSRMMRAINRSKNPTPCHLCTLRFAFGLLLFAFCLAACGPDRRATVKVDAATGYCPVCGMKVMAADDWTAEIHYKDGTKLMFEAPGDLLAFYTSPEKYKAGPIEAAHGPITEMLFKDYNTKKPFTVSQFNGQQVVFIYDSRVDGPMGPDFIPFDNVHSNIESFVTANGGKIAFLNEVFPGTVERLKGKR